MFGRMKGLRPDSLRPSVLGPVLAPDFEDLPWLVVWLVWSVLLPSPCWLATVLGLDIISFKHVKTQVRMTAFLLDVHGSAHTARGQRGPRTSFPQPPPVWLITQGLLQSGCALSPKRAGPGSRAQIMSEPGALWNTVCGHPCLSLGRFYSRGVIGICSQGVINLLCCNNVCIMLHICVFF